MLSLPWEHAARKQLLQARKPALTRNQVSRHRDLGPPSPQSRESTCLLFRSLIGGVSLMRPELRHPSSPERLLSTPM